MRTIQGNHLQFKTHAECATNHLCAHHHQATSPRLSLIGRSHDVLSAHSAHYSALEFLRRNSWRTYWAKL
eukprot:scaffold10060_cov144-Skeletonema_dohrnii-CCMP3373.AAC.2